MFLSRIVRIGQELFVMSASVSRARAMAQKREPNHEQAAELTDLFCREARRRVRAWFDDLWRNSDKLKYEVAGSILENRHAWLEKGGLTLEEVFEAEVSENDREAAESEIEPAVARTGTGVGV